MKKIKTSIIITGICCITALEIFALYKGIDGILLTLIVGIIAAAIGVAIPSNKIIK